MPEAGEQDPLWPEFVTRTRGSFAVDLSPDQVLQLRAYLSLLGEWNRKFNLTAIEKPEEVLTKHFLDSLSCRLMVDLPAASTLIDVGTGAGFPGLVLKIAFPHLQVTLLDSLEKRLRFLDRVIADLGLSGVATVHVRAEDAAQAGPGSLRERFDVVTSRAVARLRVLAEWTLPFAQVGGCLLAMKGPGVEAEVAEAAPAVRRLGGADPVIRELVLPGTELGRSLVRMDKVRATPRDLPRRPGTARKAPL